MGSYLGVQKIAAGKTGLSLQDYQHKISQGFKWCSLGKHWNPVYKFQLDKSRGDGFKAHCKECSYRPKIVEAVHLKPPSIKLQLAASSAVKYAVQKGILPKVTTLMCGCGNPARQYHHYLGYEVEHRLAVKALCISCHRQVHKHQL